MVCAGAMDTFEIFVWSMQTGRLLEVGGQSSLGGCMVKWSIFSRGFMLKWFGGFAGRSISSGGTYGEMVFI